MISQTGKQKIKALNKSFTLLELILVILIISILTGLSTPMFRKVFADLQLDGFCSEFSAIMNYTRQSAIFDRNEYRLNFNLKEAEFWIERKVTKEGQAESFDKIEGKFGKVYYPPKGVNIASNKNILTFYPDGSSDSADIKISNNNETYIITTEGATCYVKIK